MSRVAFVTSTGLNSPSFTVPEIPVGKLVAKNGPSVTFGKRTISPLVVALLTTPWLGPLTIALIIKSW